MKRVGAGSTDRKAWRVVIDVNLLVSSVKALHAGRRGTISQRAVDYAATGESNGRPFQLVTSFAMTDTLQSVLLRSIGDQGLVEEAVNAWIDMMKFGPERLDPLLVLGGTPNLSLKDREDGGVLATALASGADFLVTDNLKDFRSRDCEVFETSVLKSADGRVRRLVCQLHATPSGASLLIVHPADFVQWIEKRFDMSPASIRAVFGPGSA